ncbi:MAG: dihydroneopterin aldolase [Edaphocola sp.]
MLTVALHGVRFHAPTGLYPQEDVLGNELEIDIEVSVPAAINELPLIDYATLHDIIGREVAAPASLLEHLLAKIANAVHAAYPQCSLKLQIKKLHPPMPGQTQWSLVRWED